MKATLEQYLEIGRMIESGELDDEEVKRIISRRPPPKPSIREVQARHLFDLGFGAVVGCTTFEEYLEGIPEVPNFSDEQRQLFGDSIWLVDGRMARQKGLTYFFVHAGLDYTGTDQMFTHSDPEHQKSGVRWMLGQNGYRNRGRLPKECRTKFQPYEVAMDVIEGAFLFIHRPMDIWNHHILLIGSLVHGERDKCAIMGFFDRRRKIAWCSYDRAFELTGVASRAV